MKKIFFICIMSLLVIPRSQSLQYVNVKTKNLDKALVLALSAAGFSYAFYYIMRTVLESYAARVKHKLELEKQDYFNSTEL